MKAVLFYALFSLGFVGQLTAQKSCATISYTQRQLQNNLLVTSNNTIATFSPQDAVTPGTEGITAGSVITIPVVVHILYHNQPEKINDAVVIEQLKTLNKCFRHQNADSVNTPAVFKSLAADCCLPPASRFQAAPPSGRSRPARRCRAPRDQRAPSRAENSPQSSTGLRSNAPARCAK